MTVAGRAPMTWLGIGLLFVVLSACTGSSEGTARASTTSTTTPPAMQAPATGSITLGAPERPARLVAPDEVTTPAPLVVVLHGYSSNADFVDQYLGVTEQARTRGLYVLLPEGTTGPHGRQLWDATAACCNFTGTPVDDIDYLSGLIDEALGARPIDPDRVYVLGHSNGGFMAYRLACERSEQIAAVAVLAGADALDAAACEPSVPVSVLHLHGTADDIVGYSGGPSIVLFPEDQVAEGGPRRSYPGAVDTVERWAARNGCAVTAVNGTPLDLDADRAVAETGVTTYTDCDEGVVVQLDAIGGGGHIPALTRDAVGTQILDWLLARER